MTDTGYTPLSESALETIGNYFAGQQTSTQTPTTTAPVDPGSYNPQLVEYATQHGVTLGPVTTQGPTYPNLPITDEFAGVYVRKPAPKDYVTAPGRVPFNPVDDVNLGIRSPQAYAGTFTTVGEWMNEFTSMGQHRVRQYQSMMQDAGLLSEGGYIPGVPDRATLSALGVVLGGAANTAEKLSAEAVLGIAVDNQQNLALQNARRGGGGGGSARPTLNITLSNRDDLIELLDNAAQNVAGRNLASLGIDPNEFADAIQAAERDIQQRAFNAAVAGQDFTAEQLPSASTRASQFLEERARPQIEARQMANAFTALEDLVRGT